MTATKYAVKLAIKLWVRLPNMGRAVLLVAVLVLAAFMHHTPASAAPTVVVTSHPTATAAPSTHKTTWAHMHFNPDAHLDITQVIDIRHS